MGNGSEPLATDGQAVAFYRGVLESLTRARVPFLVGGAYALAGYARIARVTKDFDVFLCYADLPAAFTALSCDLSCRTEVAYAHWLAKAYKGSDFVDLIFSSGNGVASVDETWFAHAGRGCVFGQPVLLTPPEEMVWSKSFVMERERYDGADVAHIIRSCWRTLDWDRLIARFADRWRVLLAHLVLFGFIYPGERTHIPARVMMMLMDRLRDEGTNDEALLSPVCQGTLISREQYLPDIREWGYRDGRIIPWGSMTPEQIERWTAAIPPRD
jgi:hypothetical protein